jgi:hypothetical protein
MRLHIRAQDGIDAGLVAAVLAEPAEQVGVQAHGRDFFWRRHDDLGALPEFCVGGAGEGGGAMVQPSLRDGRFVWDSRSRRWKRRAIVGRPYGTWVHSSLLTSELSFGFDLRGRTPYGVCMEYRLSRGLSTAHADSLCSSASSAQDDKGLRAGRLRSS